MSPKKNETRQPKQPIVTPVTAKSPLEFRRATEDFAELYANNVRFESSLWDLKLIFGQNDQSLGPNVVVQHTAITIPWPQVKVLHLGLGLLLAEQESRIGRIKLMKGLIGEIPEQMPQVARDTGNLSEEAWKSLRKLYEDFIAANPEAGE